MKLTNLKNKLLQNNSLKTRIRKEFKGNTKDLKTKKLKIDDLQINDLKIDDLRIIGITGSRGKSTTAYIVHQYLKNLGYKSVLYSSLMIDSPASYINKDEACEVSFNSEEGLLNIIEEAEHYQADYLVLEVNESAISKGLTKDIPFTIRALTNLNPLHDLDEHSEEEYVSIKKSFFTDITDDCKCVIGFQNYSKQLYEDILGLNTYPKISFSSNHIATVNDINPDDFTILLHHLNNTPNGLEMKVRINGESHDFKTNVMMNYNAMNFVCSIAILKALEVLNIDAFNKTIANITIPGRAEVYNVNDRLIVVDAHLPMMLEELKNLQTKGAINTIKVVVGSVGSGFVTWEETFNTGKHYQARSKTRKYACNLLNQYANYVYLTENDNANEKVSDICNELQSYLTIPSSIIEDRAEAIKEAIVSSNKYDAIFISGRGNRRILCNTKDTMKLVKDSEVVFEVLKDLGW